MSKVVNKPSKKILKWHFKDKNAVPAISKNSHHDSDQVLVKISGDTRTRFGYYHHKDAKTGRWYVDGICGEVEVIWWAHYDEPGKKS